MRSSPRGVVGRSTLALVAALASLAALATQGSAPRHEGAGRAHRALALRQVVEPRALARLPSPSVAASGFDSERLWGPYNDWEPAIAVDPGSTWVYQMTTRYNGPPPCNGCTGP